ncbi:MAG: Mpv17/PMP22 family protein [Paenibacillus sp.]|nr:Mpv17/PMP22 family protein [Paenibacillus sp.]
MFLDKFFPMPAVTGVVTKAVQSQITRKANGMAIKRMLTDQLLFAPAGLVVFFTAMGLAEGGWENVKEKFQDAYMPALIANYKVWPAVQFINFKFMPLQYRLPFVSSLGIVWNAYLSWLNNASKQEEQVLEMLEKEDTGLETMQIA